MLEPEPHDLPKLARAAKNLAHIDGLRALAAVYVLLCHAFLQVNFRGHPLSLFTKRCLQLFFYGHFAVSLFIVLSGFCLMLPVVRGDGILRGGAWSFFLRRARRIVPPYYAAMALSLGLIATCIHQKTGTHWDISIPVTGRSVLTHLLLIQDLTGDEANLNHAFWSISVEWRIYFLFPLLIWSWSRLGPVASTVVSLIGSWLVSNWGMRWIGNPLSANYVGLFALGMLAAGIVHPMNAGLWVLRRLPWGTVTTAMTLVVALMFFPDVWGGPHLRVYVGDYVVGVWAMTLLVATSRDLQGWLTRCLGWQPLAFVGTFAYSIYLIHAPLLQVLWQYVFDPLQDQPMPMFAALTLLGTPLIVGFSYAFFLLCERPFLGPVRRRTEETLLPGTAFQPAP